MKISLQRYFKAAGIKTNKQKNYLNEIFLQYKMQLSTRKKVKWKTEGAELGSVVVSRLFPFFSIKGESKG